MSYLGYRLALYLALALSFLDVAFLLYANYFRWNRLDSIAIYAAVALVLSFGLWVQSKIARYAGGVVCLFAAAAVAWPIASGAKPAIGIGLLWVVSMGLLSLALGCVLLFSTTFANEFEHQREIQPAYKRHLRNGAIVILGVAIVVATLNDIIHLFSL